MRFPFRCRGRPPGRPGGIRHMRQKRSGEFVHSATLPDLSFFSFVCCREADSLPYGVRARALRRSFDLVALIAVEQHFAVAKTAHVPHLLQDGLQLVGRAMLPDPLGRLFQRVVTGLFVELLLEEAEELPDLGLIQQVLFVLLRFPLFQQFFLLLFGQFHCGFLPNDHHTTRQKAHKRPGDRSIGSA